MERLSRSSQENNSNFKKILTGTTAAIFLATYFGVSQISKESGCVGETDFETPSLALCSDPDGHVIVFSGDVSYTLPSGVHRITQTIFNKERNKLYYYRDITPYSFEVNYLDLKTGLYGEPLTL